jgi:hypothetical protein
MVWSGDIVVVVVPKEYYQLLVKTIFQSDDPGGGKKGRVCISITIPKLVIISYPKCRNRDRGYHGTTTTPQNSHAGRFTLQACTHTHTLSYFQRCQVSVTKVWGACKGAECSPNFGCQSSLHTRAMRRIITGILPHNRS